MIESLRNLPAPAKLNLFLHVTGRRADGYHLLETVFEFVDLCDRVHLARRDDGAIVRRNPLAGLAPEADLAVRAARLLAAETGCRFGVEIAIDKRIPMGAGLGGGSSDAATVLLGLNRLWELRLDRRRLMALGLRLGADVPAFVFGRRAFARGIGERLRALPGEPAWFVLVAPPVAVPTASVFGCAKLTRDTKPLKISGLSRGGQVFRGRNDLQDVVVARQPEVAAALDALRQAAREVGCDPRAARMSGSGACVFLPAPGEPQARQVRDRLLGRIDAGVMLARSLAAHPLRDWAFGPAPRQRRGTRPG